MSNHANGSKVWSKRDLSEAVLALEFQTLTEAPGEIALFSSRRICPTCGEAQRVVILPRSQCVECWSKSIIGKWEVQHK